MRRIIRHSSWEPLFPIRRLVSELPCGKRPKRTDFMTSTPSSLELLSEWIFGACLSYFFSSMGREIIRATMYWCTVFPIRTRVNYRNNGSGAEERLLEATEQVRRMNGVGSINNYGVLWVLWVHRHSSCQKSTPAKQESTRLLQGGYVEECGDD